MLEEVLAAEETVDDELDVGDLLLKSHFFIYFIRKSDVIELRLEAAIFKFFKTD